MFFFGLPPINPHVFGGNSHLSTGKHRPQELYLDPVVAVILLLLAALFAAGTMITTRRGAMEPKPALQTASYRVYHTFRQAHIICIYIYIIYIYI